MAPSLYYVFLSSSLAFFYFHLSHSAKQGVYPKGSTGIHLNIKKDTTTLQYYTTLEMGTVDSNSINRIVQTVNVVIDLGGANLWFDCDGYNSTSYVPTPCGSRLCKADKLSGCRDCDLGGPPRPGCTNNTCEIYAYNEIDRVAAPEGLGKDVMVVDSTDGLSVIASNKVPNFPFLCVDSLVLKRLASGTKGVVGLGRSPMSFPAQIAGAFKLPHPHKLAICIPSSSKTGFGDIFVGGGPYYMLPYTKDLSRSLVSTPLLINPVSTAAIFSPGDPSYEYFINVTSIRVGGVRLSSLNSSLLVFEKNGFGGTKLSTVAPYTVLHTTIYKALVNKFVKEAVSKKIKRVTSVAAFGACFSSNTIANIVTGPDVPSIDLVLQKGVYWRIYGANSMVKVRKDVLCLGFVDGGSEYITSVVLGGHQLENVLVEFDVATSVLGFTSSLLLHNTSCSHYRIFQ